MKSTGLRWPLPIVTLSLLACTDGGVTRPARPAAPAAPAASIADAAHGFAAGFYWLPPMARQSTITGLIDAELAPVVQICELREGTCNSIIAAYTTSTGPGLERVRWDAAGQHYHVNWHTDQFDLKVGSTYRITTRAGDDVLLGFADVMPVSTGRDLKNVDTDEFVPLIDGRTLPIKFRIMKGIVGAVAVDPATATITVDGAQHFTATSYDLHHQPLTGSVVTWASSDRAVAMVDADGTAIGTGDGEAAIIARAGTVSGSAALTVASTPGRITASISVNPSTGICERGIVFSQTSQQSDPRTALILWEWDFNHDGLTFVPQASTTNPTQTFTRVYSTIGSRTVALRVTDSRHIQLLVTTVVPVTLENIVPTAAAGGPYELFLGEAITLAGSGSDPNLGCGDVLRYDWDLDGNGQYGDAEGAVVPLSATALSAIGFVRPLVPTPTNTTIERSVRLRVRDLASTDEPTSFGTSLAIVRARVNEPFAVAQASTAQINGSCPNKAAANFISSGSFHGAAPVRAITRYEWQFASDGNPFSFTPAVGNETPVDVSFSDFPAPGVYQVRLRVTDDNVPSLTSIATASVTVVVSNHAPIAVATPLVDASGIGYYAAIAGAPLTLDGGKSSDPAACYGDRIVEYLWDMNGDGLISNPIVNPTTLVETPLGQSPQDVRTLSSTFQYRNLNWRPGTQSSIRLQVRDDNVGQPGTGRLSAFSLAEIRVTGAAAP